MGFKRHCALDDYLFAKCYLELATKVAVFGIKLLFIDLVIHYYAYVPRAVILSTENPRAAALRTFALRWPRAHMM